MSISELNHFMTYVIEGWALLSLGSISIGFVSFVARRIQEDLEAEALALTESVEETRRSPWLKRLRSKKIWLPQTLLG